MDTWWIDHPRLLGSRNPRRDGFGVLVSLLKVEEEPPRYDISRVEILEQKAALCRFATLQ